MNAFGQRALGARLERMQTSAMWSGLAMHACKEPAIARARELPRPLD